MSPDFSVRARALGKALYDIALSYGMTDEQINEWFAGATDQFSFDKPEELPKILRSLADTFEYNVLWAVKL